MCLEKFGEKTNVLSKSARITLLCFFHTELLGYPKIIIENKRQKVSLWIFSSVSGYHIILWYLKRKILWFHFSCAYLCLCDLLSFAALMSLSQYWNLDPFSENHPLYLDKYVMICLSISEDLSIGNEILVSPKFPVESHFPWASFLSEISVGTHTYCTLLTFSWIGFKEEEVWDFHFCGILRLLKDWIHSVYHVSFSYFYAD